MENKVADFREKESSLNLSYQKHQCSGSCLMKMPFTSKGENPLQLPVKCHFQRRHAKTNSHSSALHVSYKTPCGRSLRPPYYWNISINIKYAITSSICNNNISVLLTSLLPDVALFLSSLQHDSLIKLSVPAVSSVSSYFFFLELPQQPLL